MIRWRRTEACIAAAFCLALSSSGGHAELAAQTTSTTVRVVEVDPAGDSIGVVADAEVCVSAIGDPRLYYARTDGAGRAVVSDHPATGLRAVISRRGYTSHAVGPVDVGTVPVTRRFEMRRLEPGEEDLLPVPTCSSSPRITSIEVNSGAPTTFSTTVQLDWTTNATFEQPVEYCASVEADGCEPGDPSHWTGLPLATGWSCASPPTMMVSDPDGFCPGYSTTATLDEKVLGDQIVYLSMRYAGGGGQPTLARAGIERLPRAPTLVAFQIDGGAIAAVGTDVRLGWLMEPTPVEAALQFCAIEEQRDCLDAEWQPAPAPGSSPGLGPAYTVDRDLSGAPGTRRVHLQTRYADYPDAVSNRLSDGIVLVSEERTLPGPVRFEEYVLDPAEVIDFAVGEGWEFDSLGLHECGIASPAFVGDRGVSFWVPAPAGMIRLLVGSKACTYSLFGGRMMNEPWTFVRYVYDDSFSTTEFCRFAVALEPEAGGRRLENIQTVIATSVARPNTHCLRIVTDLVIRGPAGASFEDAFVDLGDPDP